MFFGHTSNKYQVLVRVQVFASWFSGSSDFFRVLLDLRDHLDLWGPLDLRDLLDLLNVRPPIPPWHLPRPDLLHPPRGLLNLLIPFRTYPAAPPVPPPFRSLQLPGQGSRFEGWRL